jgi:hypothetical protein
MASVRPVLRRDCLLGSANCMVSEVHNLRTRVVPAAWRARLDPAADARVWRLRVWFYLAVPLLLGFLLGWLRVGRVAAWPIEWAVPYWLVLSLSTTWLTALGTVPVALLLRPLRGPLWLTLLLGQLVAGYLLVRPFAVLYVDGLNALVPAERAVAPLAGGLTAFLQRFPSNAVLWVGLNLLFYYAFRMPRFGYAPPQVDAGPTVAAGPARTTAAAAGRNDSPTAASAAAATCAPPAFMGRVRGERRGELLALKADGHYLHVYTDSGTDMILYRLSDALAEVAPHDGARVHRSWWVAARALGPARHPEHLELSNGLEVPVSRSYRLAARERGWLEQ